MSFYLSILLILSQGTCFRFGNLIIMCFSSLFPDSWLVSVLRTTTEMRIKPSSSAWSPRSCTISRTAQTASPVKRPRWGWENRNGLSCFLPSCADRNSHLRTSRKKISHSFRWSHGITIVCVDYADQICSSLKCFVFCMACTMRMWKSHFFSVFLGEASFTYHLSW